MARIAVNPVSEGDGLVLHAVVQACRLGFEIGGDEPICGSLNPCGATGDPELDADKAHGRHAEKKENKERQVFANEGEVGADACWIQLDDLLGERTWAVRANLDCTSEPACDAGEVKLILPV
jgi:hypothetical protein